MEAPNIRPSATASIIRWVARILCILAIAFISMFAFDVFEQGSLGQKIIAFLLHMIPSFVLIICLIIAWKHELVGGILIAFIGLATTVFTYVYSYSHRLPVASQGFQAGAPGRRVLSFFLIISLPLIVPGVLFIISHFLHRPKGPATQTP